MRAVTFLAATNGGYLIPVILFICGLLCGMLLLAVGELSLLGYLKFRELRQAWGLSKPAPEPEEASLPDPPPPAASRSNVADKPRLHVIQRPAPTTSRNGHTVHAQTALRRNAGYEDDDLSA
jgi:hypothetical protein